MNRLCFKPVALSLSVFLAMTYILCFVYGIIFHEYAMRSAWEAMLPGFFWLTWKTFFIGLVVTISYCVYAALLFVPLYNHFTHVFGEKCAGHGTRNECS